MVETQVIPIDFGQGLDQKTDPKLVVPGKLIVLEDCVFTTAKRLTKRNGYAAITSSIAGGGNLTAPKMVQGFKDQLICADLGSLYSYSESQSKWINKGAYNSVNLDRSVVNSYGSATGSSDVIVSGNYAMYGFSYMNGVVNASVVDLQSGLVIGALRTAGLTTNINIPVKCILLSGTTFAIAYVSNISSQIVTRIATISSGVVTFGSEVTASANYNGANFDIIGTSTGAAVLYQSSTGIKITTLDSAGVIVTSANIADANFILLSNPAIYLSQNSTNGNFWIYWCTNSGIGSNFLIKYAVYTTALVSVLTTTLVVDLGDPTHNATNMISVDISATQQTLYFGFINTFNTQDIDQTSHISVSSAGVVGSGTLFSYGVLPFSKPFTITLNAITNTYAVFAYRSQSPSTFAYYPYIQPTFFIVKLDATLTSGTPIVVSRFASGQVNSRLMSGTPNFTCNASVISSTQILFSCGLVVQEQIPNMPPGVFGPDGPEVIAFVYSYKFDFNHENAYIATNTQDLCLLNGSMIQEYDGFSTSEFGFNLFPEIKLTQYTDASGLIANGTYSYLAIYQWTDAQGNLHQSAPSTASQIVTTGGNNAVHVVVTNPYLSSKNGISVAIYRTTASGSIYYLVTDAVNIQTFSPSSSGNIQFNDLHADSAITANFQAYTYPASAVLENTTPPPSMILIPHNNRLWFTDAENPNTVWYTKSVQDLVGLSPSGFLTQQIDHKFGPIKALAEMDEKIVYLKESGICYQSGDGANDTGTNSSLSFPAFVPSDVGCSQLKSVVGFPGGVIFKSLKGIYMIDRAVNVSYIGMDVESYNSQTITSARLMVGKSQIRFLSSDDNTLMYDYIMKQWGTFKNHLGVSADFFNGNYVYVNTAGLVLQETPGLYLDNGSAITTKLRTSWLALSSVQGFQRVKRLELLGDYTTGGTHGVRISIAYDFSESFSTPIAYTFSSTSGAYQYRERLPRQKCDAISLLIEEVTTGSSADYIDFTNISFEAGMKKGLNKLGASQSVG